MRAAGPHIFCSSDPKRSELCVSNHLFQGGDERRGPRVRQLQQLVLEGGGDEALQDQPEVMGVCGQALHQSPAQGESLSTEGLLVLHHLVVHRNAGITTNRSGKVGVSLWMALKCRKGDSIFHLSEILQVNNQEEGPQETTLGHT